MATETAETEVSQQPLWAQLGTGIFNPTTELAEAPEEEAPDTTEKPSPEAVVPSETEKKVETAPKGPEEPQVVLKSESARKNFAKLEEAKKQEADARRQAEDRLKEYEQREAKWKEESTQRDTRIQELETRLATINPDEMTHREKKYQEELGILRGELRVAAVQRDPDFIRQYETPKIQLRGMMKDMALAVGATEDDFKMALKNPSKMEEIRDSLDSVQQRRWDAAVFQAEQIEIQKELAIQNADKTYEEISQQRAQGIQQQRAQLLQQNLHMARTIGNEPFEKFEFLKERTDLKQQINQTLTALAGGEGAEKFTTDAIFREITASIVQRDFLQQQAKTIEAKEAEIAELKKTLEERESFIQEKHGSIPRNEVNGATQEKKQEDEALWKQIKVVRG